MSSRSRATAAMLVTAAVIGLSPGPAIASTPQPTPPAQQARPSDPEADGLLGNVVSGVPIVGAGLRGLTSLLSLLPVVGDVVKPLTGDPLTGVRNAVKTIAILGLLFPKKP